MLKITITNCLNSVIFFIHQFIKILFSCYSVRSTYFFQKSPEKKKIQSDICYQFIYCQISHVSIFYLMCFAFLLLTKKIHRQKEYKKQNRVLNYIKISSTFFLVKLTISSLFAKQSKKLIPTWIKLLQTNTAQQNKKQRLYPFMLNNLINSQSDSSVLNLAFAGYHTESTPDSLNQNFNNKQNIHYFANGKSQNFVLNNNFFFGFGNKTNKDSQQSLPNSSIKKKAFVTSLETSVNGTLKNQSKEATDKFVSITYEEIGLFPRSFNRVFDRFFKQIFSDVENLVLQEYRFYRYLFLTTIKTIFILFFVPLIINVFTKNYIVRPLTEYFWNTKQPEIFLNSYQQKRAFSEFQEFEEQLFFESLISLAAEQPTVALSVQALGDNSTLLSETQTQVLNETIDNSHSSRSLFSFGFEKSVAMGSIINKSNESLDVHMSQLRSDSLRDLIQGPNEWEFGIRNPGINVVDKPLAQPIAKTDLILFNSDSGAVSGNAERVNADTILIQTQNKLQQKTLELAIRYNNYSIEAITNFFADLFSFVTLLYLFISLEIQINITKSFLLEVFFGLDDSKKSLLILLVTDLLVGYHSPNIWELFFEFIFNHYGIPESQTVIFLLVATLPVLLDVLFKYLIFRHLNRSSPTTVATYHAMIE